MPCSVSREKAKHRCDLLTNSMFASSSRVGARPSSIIRLMRACASRTLEIGLRGTRIVNYSRRAQLFPYRRVLRRTARPVGICGNNWAVSPDRHAKESLRTRGFGGRYSRYFAGDFALWRCRNSIRRYSAAPKREFRSQFPPFPLSDSGFAVPSFQLHPVFGAVSSRVPPGDAMSCFVGFGDKSWDSSKNPP